MDFEKFCSQILEADPKIRLATVFDQWSKHIAGGIRHGITNLLSEHMQKELVGISVLDWQARKKMSKVLGKTRYTMAEYEKLKLFSFYLGDDFLLLVSTEKDANTDTVVDKVIDIYHKLAS